MGVRPAAAAVRLGEAVLGVRASVIHRKSDCAFCRPWSAMQGSNQRLLPYEGLLGVLLGSLQYIATWPTYVASFPPNSWVVIAIRGRFTPFCLYPTTGGCKGMLSSAARKVGGVGRMVSMVLCLALVGFLAISPLRRQACSVLDPPGRQLLRSLRDEGRCHETDQPHQQPGVGLRTRLAAQAVVE
jgi:hypothetical protein